MAERDSIIDDVKSKLDILELVRETHKLAQSGDEWRGAHKKHDSDSGLSLNVNPKRQLWHCFNCGAGGDAIDWIADRHNLDRKKDFVEILKIAAEKAGVPLTNTRDIDIESERERKLVFDVLKTAAEHFHENLTPKTRSEIMARWGISDHTIDMLLIGIARNDDALEMHLAQKGFTRGDMLKSGLFFDWGERLHPHFMGRFVFPYWKGGMVRYMAARATKQTPLYKGEKDGRKYLKLLTHRKERTYVSKHVRNDTLYGEDSLNGVSDWCLITEGVTDCIMALQAGIPCISPVTTKFRKADYEKILSLVKRFGTVYICR